MGKLTLSVDSEVIAQAKRIAEESGTSVSSLFERFIRVLVRRSGSQRVSRNTRKATGLVKLPPGEDYRDLLADALAEKYGFKK